MAVFNIAQPLTLVLLLVATVLLVFLGKEIKKPFPVFIALAFFLVLVIIHSIQLATIPKIYYEDYHGTLLSCLAVDLVMIFISFFSYLWIDDMSAKFFKKKSIDDSLDWF